MKHSRRDSINDKHTYNQTQMNNGEKKIHSKRETEKKLQQVCAMRREKKN